MKLSIRTVYENSTTDPVTVLNLLERALQHLYLMSFGKTLIYICHTPPR